jgi:hypothetical protein
MIKRLLCTAFLVLSLSSAAAGAAQRKGATLSLPWLRAEGTKIVNDRGKTVRLKGLFLPNNTWGNWIWPISAQLEKEGKDSMIKPTEQDAWVLTDQDFEIFAKLKLNYVVYDVNYELFEAGNVKREANLDKLVGHVKRFNALRIYVIVNFAGSPGLNVNTGGGEREKRGDKRLKSKSTPSRTQGRRNPLARAVRRCSRSTSSGTESPGRSPTWTRLSWRPFSATGLVGERGLRWNQSSKDAGAARLFPINALNGIYAPAQASRAHHY